MSDQNDFNEKRDVELIWEPVTPGAHEPAPKLEDIKLEFKEADPFTVETPEPKPAVHPDQTAAGTMAEAAAETPGPAAGTAAESGPDKEKQKEAERPGKAKKEKKGLFGRKPKDDKKHDSAKGAAAAGDASDGSAGKKGKRTSFLFKLKLLLCLILIILIVFSVFMYIVPAFNRADKTKVSGSADWMGALASTRKISTVNIPGTHDSATRTVQFAYIFKCQSFTIEKQLEAGYRYLDIRLEVDDGHLMLVHAFADCKKGSMPWSEDLYLEDVLKQCYDYLDEHPTEFIIFAVKQEHGRQSVNEFERLLMSYIMEEPDKWLLTDSIPTVGQARGKMILMRRYEDVAGYGQNAGIPLIWEDQGSRKNVGLNIAEENNGTYTLWVQDRYQYETEEKWTAFTEGLKNGKVDASNISIHFLSTKGKGIAGHPYKFAKELNEKFISEAPALSGWIIMDFASAPMAEQVYQSNFK